MHALGLPLSGVRDLGALAAHLDDCEIGCSGTLLRLARAFPDLTADIVIATGELARIARADRGAAWFSCRSPCTAGSKQLTRTSMSMAPTSEGRLR